MITTVSLSPAIDRRLEFDTFTLEGTNRVVSAHTESAGKAIDVALTARALGLPIRCIGLLPGGGGPITDRLDALGVPHDFLAAPGTVRVNEKLYDRKTGGTTEVNEAVPEAPAPLLAAASDAAIAAARECDFLVLTGSLPTGCPAGWYADVIRRARAEAPACRCVLDAEGERFTRALGEGPWLVKPNLHELSLAVGRALDGVDDVLAAARALLAQGAGCVVVSMGGDGALAATRDEAWLADALRVPIKTTTGAGDAMVAGLLKGFGDGGSLADALRSGIAAATSRCAYAGERYADAALYGAYLPRVSLRRL